MKEQKIQKAQEEDMNIILIRQRIQEMEERAEIRARTHKQSKRVVRELLKDPINNYHEDKYFFENIIPEARRVKQLQEDHKVQSRPVRLPEIAQHAQLHDDR